MKNTILYVIPFFLLGCATEKSKDSNEKSLQSELNTDHVEYAAQASVSDYDRLAPEEVIASLPKELQAYKDKILKSEVSYNSIFLTASNNTPLTVSKVGGYPYLPKNKKYPKASNGKPLDFLAQINFSEMPAMEGYPTTGIVQFYIALDDLYGLDFDDQVNQNDYRVIYHETTDATSRTKFPELAAIRNTEMYLSPLLGNVEYKMSFASAFGYVPLYGLQFEKYFGQETWPFFESFDDKEDEMADAYTEVIHSDGHKVGGYPFFTQEDPRLYDKRIEDWILLFQLDTDQDIMWGDSGVGNFFISKEDLKNKDFSKVYYTWDCY